MYSPKQLSFARLDQLMPAEFRPIETISDRLRDENDVILNRRASAFAEFATRVEQLEQWIDNVSTTTLEQYRARFRAFVSALMSDTKCYVRQDRPLGESVTMVTESTQALKLAPAISESCAATIFVPEHSLALIGHDEFGCHLMVLRSEPASLSWINTHATKAALIVLRHPKRVNR